MSGDILIVDDEKDIRSLISLTLEDEGFSTIQASNAAEARSHLVSRPPICLILDIWMRDSDMDGLELLSWCRSLYPDIPALMISGHGTIETAVHALRMGAYDFIEKPFKAERLLLTVNRAIQAAKLQHENDELRSRAADLSQIDIIGQSAAIKAIKSSVERLSTTASRVLIEGPSGSGKELVARKIHDASERANHKFVVANCARLTAEKAELELFGSEAIQDGRRVVGLFEQAHLGTLYFDEICDLPVKTQAKLVRAVAEQKFRRMGGAAEVQVNVRIMSASSQNLANAIEEGRLREDLYYRLGVVSLTMPSLAERREDIALLAKYFARLSAERLGRTIPKLGDDLLNALRAYHWPGSVRQMRNVMESMLILAHDKGDELLSVADLPREITSTDTETKPQMANDIYALPLREAREIFEADYLKEQLNRFEGNISKVAKMIGMERSALHRKLKALHIQEK
ncbi:MAG: sigma-54-dependent transcriptional regulator [Candidatus Puniceispirillaceae bacterium]